MRAKSLGMGGGKCRTDALSTPKSNPAEPRSLPEDFRRCSRAHERGLLSGRARIVSRSANCRSSPAQPARILQSQDQSIEFLHAAEKPEALGPTRIFGISAVINGSLPKDLKLIYHMRPIQLDVSTPRRGVINSNRGHNHVHQVHH